jgi:hypothetical protein
MSSKPVQDLIHGSPELLATFVKLQTLADLIALRAEAVPASASAPPSHQVSTFLSASKSTTDLSKARLAYAQEEFQSETGSPSVFWDHLEWVKMLRLGNLAANIGAATNPAQPASKFPGMKAFVKKNASLLKEYLDAYADMKRQREAMWGRYQYVLMTRLKG